MINTYDSNVWFDAVRNAFAPVMRAQEEGLKALDRVTRLSYSVAGDCLDASLTQAHAALEARSPAELMTKGTELAVKLGEKLRSRAQELANVTTEVQGSFSRAAGEATAKAAEPGKRAAA